MRKSLESLQSCLLLHWYYGLIAGLVHLDPRPAMLHATCAAACTAAMRVLGGNQDVQALRRGLQGLGLPFLFERARPAARLVRRLARLGQRRGPGAPPHGALCHVEHHLAANGDARAPLRWPCRDARAPLHWPCRRRTACLRRCSTLPVTYLGTVITVCCIVITVQ